MYRYECVFAYMHIQIYVCMCLAFMHFQYLAASNGTASRSCTRYSWRQCEECAKNAGANSQMQANQRKTKSATCWHNNNNNSKKKNLFTCASARLDFAGLLVLKAFTAWRHKWHVIARGTAIEVQNFFNRLSN